MKNHITKWYPKKSINYLDIILSSVLLLLIPSVPRALEAFEWFAEWSRQYEEWHVNEIASLLIVLTFFFRLFLVA